MANSVNNEKQKHTIGIHSVGQVAPDDSPPFVRCALG